MRIEKFVEIANSQNHKSASNHICTKVYFGDWFMMYLDYDRYITNQDLNLYNKLHIMSELLDELVRSGSDWYYLRQIYVYPFIYNRKDVDYCLSELRKEFR